MNNYAILVNTTDSFEDCWDPFFCLFKKYWPNYSGVIYLNTETKAFNYGGLNIICVRNNINTPEVKISWSECVRRALDTIDNEIILYLQDDYFLKDFVTDEIIEGYAGLMRMHKMDCIHLTDQNSAGPFQSSEFEGLKVLGAKAADRISCQAAFWKKDVLRSYLHKDESGWQFETYGTKRSHFINHQFYSVDRDRVKHNTFELIPYIFTGIVKGKWLPEVEDLFNKNQIVVDLSKRGFYNVAENKPSLGKRIINYIKRKPKEISTGFDLLNIKYKQNK